jgi:predicted kinase
LEETLYNVYEANRLSEEVPGVGKNFLAMYVLHENGKMKEVTDAGYKHLRNLYATYGPHDIKKREALTVRDEFFEDL